MLFDREKNIKNLQLLCGTNGNYARAKVGVLFIFRFELEYEYLIDLNRSQRLLSDILTAQ